MSRPITWRTILNRVKSFDFESNIRTIRRLPRRKLAVLAIIITLFFIFFLRSSKPSSTRSKEQQCSSEKLKFWDRGIEDLDVGIGEDSVEFVGNGYFGIDARGQMRVQKSSNSRVLDAETNFFPGLNVEIETSAPVEHTTLTDFKNGILNVLKCFSIDDECACITLTTYAHRTRPNLFVQNVLISNPTKSTVRINLSRLSSNWWSNSKIGEITVHQRQLGNMSYAIVCTDPTGKLSVLQKREETLNFICSLVSKEAGQDKDLKMEAVNTFSEAKALKNLKEEHTEGWTKLNRPYFSVFNSKAPNTLNGDRINATKYILLSNLRAPTIENNVNVEIVKQLSNEAMKNELCYTGHSNLFYPSRLWQDWDTPVKLISLVNTWILTFEKRGCSNLLKTEALGAAQAFIQSLTASSYHDSHLEVALDAHDLHREMSFGGIPIHSSIGVVGTINVDIKLDAENRPYFMVSSTNQLFACDGGCLDKPVSLGRVPIQIPVKVTKPVTSLLYIATNRRHLEQLRSAIHVSEVGSAPAHEDEVIELHRSGEASGGLPTIFWIFLVIIIIIFHLILAKLFWNEWRKGDMTPYNPYLRNRYSSLRPH